MISRSSSQRAKDNNITKSSNSILAGNRQNILHDHSNASLSTLSAFKNYQNSTAMSYLNTGGMKSPVAVKPILAAQLKSNEQTTNQLSIRESKDHEKQNTLAQGNGTTSAIEFNLQKPNGIDLNNSYRKMYLMGSSSGKKSTPVSQQKRGFSKNEAATIRIESSFSDSKNKENFNNSLSKIFFNSPRVNQQDSKNASINLSTSSKKKRNANDNSMLANKNSNNSNKTNQIKQSLVLTKNITLKDNNNINEFTQPATASLISDKLVSSQDIEDNTLVLSKTQSTINPSSNQAKEQNNNPKTSRPFSSNVHESTQNSKRQLFSIQNDRKINNTSSSVRKNNKNILAPSKNNSICLSLNEGASNRPSTKGLNSNNERGDGSTKSVTNLSLIGTRKSGGQSFTSKVNSYSKEPKDAENYGGRAQQQQQYSLGKKVGSKEYKELQEKLNYLENKIMNIKSNIEENNAKNEGAIEASEITISRVTDLTNSRVTDLTNPRCSDLAYSRNISTHSQMSTLNSPSENLEPQQTQQKENKQQNQPQVQTRCKTPNNTGNNNKSSNNSTSKLTQGGKSNNSGANGLGSFVTQVNRGQTIPFSFSNQLQLSQSPTSPPSSQSPSQQQQFGGTKSISSTSITLQKSSKQQSSQNIMTNSSSNSYAEQHQRNTAMVTTESTTQNTDQQDSQTRPFSQPFSSANQLKTQGNVDKSQQSQAIATKTATKTRTSKLYYASSVIHAFSNPRDESVLTTLARDHLMQTIQSLHFSKIFTQPSASLLESKRVYFTPHKAHKKTIIFDLDETLIHCNEHAKLPSDVILPIIFPTGEIIEAGINVRPFAVQILQELSKLYEVVVFTASHSCYANVVLDYLDPDNNLISYRLFREHCVQTDEGVYVKDLRVIGNRNMKDMLLVDNAAYSFGFQLENGLPIIPFYDNKDDQELKHLTHFLKTLHDVTDLQEVSKKLLKIDQYVNYHDPIDLLQGLYSDFIRKY